MPMVGTPANRLPKWGLCFSILNSFTKRLARLLKAKKKLLKYLLLLIRVILIILRFNHLVHLQTETSINNQGHLIYTYTAVQRVISLKSTFCSVFTIYE